MTFGFFTPLSGPPGGKNTGIMLLHFYALRLAKMVRAERGELLPGRGVKEEEKELKLPA